MIRFGEDVCRDLGCAVGREWLETNGVGGYASSTIAGLNTRRYHGLLVAATKPPVGRLVLLSKFEETLIVGGSRHELSANQYPGVVHPRGHLYLKEFRLDPFPVFAYEAGGVRLTKTVFMARGENTTVITYEAERLGESFGANDKATHVNDRGGRGDGGTSEFDESPFTPRPSSLILQLRPLLAFRDYHHLTRENERLDARVSVGRGRLLSVRPYADMPALYFAHDAAARVEPGACWYRDFEYEIERERGFDFREDLFSPFTLTFDLTRKTRATVVASIEPRDAGDADAWRRREVERRARVVASAPSGGEFVRALTLAADQFVVARGEQKTVLAGYHWFSDWGRDTMIALPGLTLATRRFDDARAVLREFARHASRGMLPNRFPDRGEEPDYNTADATLWFFEAARAYLAHTGDTGFIREHLYPVLADIIDWHVRGTRFGIRVDSDGLLSAGEEGVQLTWMDAKVGDWVVTPRRGKPVEIQALWHNALRVTEDLARGFGDEARADFCADLAERALASFARLFWNEELGCLYDVIDGERRDPSIRPNQVFAVSLAHPLVGGERARQLLEVIERELLTPYGLRSLSPRDPAYRGRYEGSPLERDGSYHQGAVWAWLTGPFVTAYLKTHGDAARAKAAGWLSNFRAHLAEAGLNQISEIFDGDPPHRPRGCVAQAWSVAEVLRVAVEHDLAG